MSIRVEGIGKRFGNFTALDNITLDFETGKLTALLGPSGCGKTTLLRIIAGLEEADQGQVLFEGTDAAARPIRERQVGFVFQHYALFRHMSVFENVAFGLRVKPRRERPDEATIRRKVMDLLELVQLGWVADRSPAQLSGGQRQRIALARALAVEPQVLLLDEPFGALDAKVRRELRRWLRQLHETLHVTSIFVTHDQEEALELADRVVVMNKGRVEQTGTPKDVYENPATAFVYRFLGNTNMVSGPLGEAGLDIRGITIPVEGKSRQGGLATAFIRPHDLTITREESGAGFPALVRRILEFGALARIELTGLEDGQAFDVEMPREQLAMLGVKVGDPVRLQPQRVRVFAGDDSVTG